MSLQQELTGKVAAILGGKWEPRDGRVVPDTESVSQDRHDAVKLDAVVLYADMVGSSSLIDNYPTHFATEMYKSFLYCAARVITSCGGEITAYDGDRVMAVFVGNVKNTSAAFCALKINHAVKMTINPLVAEYYKGHNFFAGKEYAIKHVVGIDSSQLYVAKTGIRGANDLVWVGRAANYAAKLSALRHEDYPAFLTKEVYDRLMAEPKQWQGKDVWTSLGTWWGRTILGSKWTWAVEYSMPT